MKTIIKKHTLHISPHFVIVAVLFLTLLPSCQTEVVKIDKDGIFVMDDRTPDEHHNWFTINDVKNLIAKHDGNRYLTLIWYDVREQYPNPITLELPPIPAEPGMYDTNRDTVDAFIEKQKVKNERRIQSFLNEVQAKLEQHIPDSLTGSFVTENLLAIKYAVCSPQFNEYTQRVVVLKSNLLDSPRGKVASHLVSNSALEELAGKAKVYVIGANVPDSLNVITLDDFERFLNINF